MEKDEIESTITYLIHLQDHDNTGFIDETKMLNLIESLSCDFSKKESIEIKNKIKKAIADKIKSKLGFLTLNLKPTVLPNINVENNNRLVDSIVYKKSRSYNDKEQIDANNLRPSRISPTNSLVILGEDDSLNDNNSNKIRIDQSNDIDVNVLSDMTYDKNVNDKRNENLNNDIF